MLALAVILAAAGMLAVTPVAARAQIGVPPVPVDPPPVPPPVVSFPAAGSDPPPAEVITDPVTPDAVCGGWYLQGRYGGRWRAGSTWWEYGCARWYPMCSGACNADRVPSLWIDHFYWDGSQPVFYGQFYGDYYWLEWTYLFCEWWWDQPTSQWYGFERPCDGTGPIPPPDDPPPSDPPSNAVPVASFAYSCDGPNCRFDAGASTDADGNIVAYAWTFGDATSGAGLTAEHAYAGLGSYAVTLTVTDDRGGAATQSKLVTIEPPPNAAPAAQLAVSCSGLNCLLDAAGSSDPDGTIVSYDWQLGDGATATGLSTRHTYATSGTYTITLSVADDDGATATATTSIDTIILAASSEVGRVYQVYLTWSGASGASFDVLRNGRQLATVSSHTYVDTLSRKSTGRYRYKVCQTATALCSNSAAVSF